MWKGFGIVAFLVIFGANLSPIEGKVYKQCELAKLLLSYGFDKSLLANCKYWSDIDWSFMSHP